MRKANQVTCILKIGLIVILVYLCRFHLQAQKQMLGEKKMFNNIVETVT